MATQQANIAAAFLRLVNASNILSSRVGALADLTTTDKRNLVAALNEIKASMPVLSSLIDDAGASTSKTWSSTKIQQQITGAITALVNGSDAANDTLKELADRITALAQADQGLLSFAQAQTLSAAQKLQGCANLGIGDPAFDFVPDINAALAAGL